MPSIRLVRNPKCVIVQWVGIGTHTHTHICNKGNDTKHHRLVCNDVDLLVLRANKCVVLVVQWLMQATRKCAYILVVVRASVSEFFSFLNVSHYIIGTYLYFSSGNLFSFSLISLSSSSSECSAGLSLQMQEPRLQFCPKASLPLQTQEPRLQFN